MKKSHHIVFSLILTSLVNVFSPSILNDAIANDAIANENAEIFDNQDIAISPSGQILAASWNDSITLFNLSDGSKIKQFDAQTDTPFVLAFSPDSSKLFASGWELTTIWDVASGKPSAQVSINENTECGGFSHDQKNVYFDDEFTQFGQKKLIVANKDLSKEKLVIENSARCNHSPDNKLLALESYIMAADGLSLKSSDIQVIDLNKASVQNTLTGDKARPYDEDMFFFDNNRKLLVRDSSDFHIWDLENNTVLRTWDSEIDVDEISVVGNLMLITADEKRRIWNLLQEPGPIETIPLPANYPKILSVELSNDGNLYTVTSFDENETKALVTIFDTKTNALKHQIETDFPTYGAYFTRDNSRLVFEAYPIKVADVSTGMILYEINQ